MEIIGHILGWPFICVGWLIVGALAGMIANSIMHTNQPMMTDLILGLVGAIVGGLIVSVLGISRPEGGLGAVITSLVVSVLGAVVIIAIWRAIARQSAK